MLSRQERTLAIDGVYIHVSTRPPGLPHHLPNYSRDSGHVDHACCEQGQERVRQWQDGFVPYQMCRRMPTVPEIIDALQDRRAARQQKQAVRLRGGHAEGSR